MVGGALALLVAFFGGAALIRIGPRLGFVDLPDDFLKPHTGAAVPLGGVVVFGAVHAGMAVEGSFDPGLFVASALLLVLGLADDRVGLSPRLRLAVEALAGVVLALTADLASLPGGPRSILAAAILVVVTVNAVNLLDGLDGLAGSVALVTAVGIAVLAATRGLGIDTSLVLPAALAGFLVWNWPPGRLFLGDNGAYTVALFLVYGFFNATPRSVAPLVLIACGLIGVFAIDLAVTLLRRSLAGRPLFAGDRSHVYDQLRDRGWPVPAVVLTFAGSQAVVAAVVVLVDQLASPWTGVGVLVAAFVGVLLILAREGFLQPHDPA